MKRQVVLMLAMVAAGMAGMAATLYAEAPATAPAHAAVEAKPLAPEAREILQTLQDRKKTLKDFTARIDYSVEHISTDVDGKLGHVDYVDSGAGGGTVQFSVDFTIDTVNGKPSHKRHSQIILDGKDLIAIDFDSKQFSKSPSPPTNSLESQIPLPIGLKVEDVTSNFNVEMRPAGKDANLPTLRLTPRLKGKFEYQQLDVTVDKKLQIPVKVIVYTNRGETTTIKFIDPDINSGKAKIITPIVPDPAQGWTINTGKATVGGTK
jgi:outer membrane lipoprotein-sorting protein